LPVPMNTGPSRTAPAKSTVLGALLVLAAFVAVFTTALFAMQRIDHVYQSTERTVNRAIRVVLRGYEAGTQMVAEMQTLFEALERLERIAVSVDLNVLSVRRSSGCSRRAWQN
jgi:hypothetical protein